MGDEQDHTSRDRHLFGPGPKRILALDGGGVRGVIAVAFLERIEEVVSQKAGGTTKLGDYFDLIGGTSTGAIIAGALALGKSTAELKDIYHRLAPRVFQPRRFHVRYLQTKFDVARLREEIAAIVGGRTLDSPDLRTGFALIAKRLDTGSPWIVSNNPQAPYWNDPPDHKFIGNRKYLLANLVRASTAAPTYFEPEMLAVADGEPLGLFVDGGVSPHNNPSLALFMMAMLKPFGLCWRTGAENLTIVSVGTGGHRTRILPADLGRMQTVTVALGAMMSLMDDAETMVLTLMQWLGQTQTPWKINSEIGDLFEDVLPSGPLFRFLRYNVNLEEKWLKENLDYTAKPGELTRLREMDDPAIIPTAYELGKLAAAQQVKPEHFP